MAFSISYIYKAIDDFSPTAKRIGRALSEVNSRVSAGISSFKRMASEFKNFRFSIGSDLKSLAASAAAFIGFRDLTSSALDFQDAMADLSAITGATGGDLAFLGEQAKAMSVAANVGQADVANAIKLVASAKSELLKDPKGLVEITKQILLLKNAAGIELSEATNVATQALNQFGVGADQAERFVNVLAAGAKVGASEIGDTGVAIIKSGVAANIAKVGFEELNAMIQVLAKSGIKGEVAGTGLKTALLKLETSGIKKIQPSVVGAAQAFENLANANLTAAQMQELFGLEAIAIGGSLMKNASLVKQWTKEITGTNIATEQAEKRLATLRSKFNMLLISIRNKFEMLFVLVAPYIERVIDGLLNIGESIKTFSAEHPKLMKFGIIVAGVATAFFVLSTAIAAVSAVVALVTSPISLIIIGISALILLISEFKGRWGELPGAAIDAIKGIFNFIVENNPVSLLIDGFKSLVKMVTNFDIGKILPKTISYLFGVKAPKPTMAPAFATINNGQQRTVVDINMNIKDRADAIDKVSTVSKGGAYLNVGKNMR